MPMTIVPGVDTTPGYEGFVSDRCGDCGGVVCGFLHAGEYGCDCGDSEKEDE